MMRTAVIVVALFRHGVDSAMVLRSVLSCIPTVASANVGDRLPR